METTLAAPVKTTIWNRNFICVFIANAMLSLTHSAVNTLVSTYATYLGAGTLLMGLLTGLFFGVSLAMRPVTGPVSTKLDKRTLMIFVFALGGVVNIGYALFPHIGMFVFFRFFHGMQYSLVGSLIMTVAGDSLPREKLASGMGIYTVGGTVMFAIAPSIGIGLLNLGTRLKDQGLGFELMFFFGAAASLLAVIPSLLLLPDKKTKAEIASTGAWYKNILTVHAIPTAVVITLVCAAYSLYNNYMVKFAAEKGIAGISIFFTVTAAFTFFSRPLSGRLAERFGIKKIMIPCLIVYAASFIVVGTSKGLASVLVGGALAAVGYGATQPSLQAMAIQTVTPLKRSVASNTLYAGIDLGFFVGPFLGSVVYKYSNYSVMYLTGIVPVALAIVCFLVFWPMYARRLKELRALEGDSGAA
ncbi:Predicted arabinose efflux permease, MFS family [Sporobacter termitidis DSM 10068]|uniref:Predicted arabinose efflux permease, MFS family n=1 Tax=Sporobacter termitidis DSM 10068 TaxID=1123282 RepID=A0A1M5XKG9_9FIRM|nr:MFS transporter [Sporobacter termitidis]SHI00152.1 Predicted arabinose efflux permease, MFS family [Sporobacter termitidis DSM 10068]